MKMSEEERFFIYLLEHYAAYKDRNTGEVLKEWEEKDIIHKIQDNYFLYHQEAITNAYADIDHLIATGNYAY